MLSAKLIDQFKSLPEGEGIQVNKDARLAVVERTMLFLEQVRANCETLATVSKRKTIKLIDAVNGVAQALQAAHLPAADVLSAALGVPVEERAVYLKEHIPDVSSSMYEIVETGKGPQRRVSSHNTVKLSQIEQLLATTQKAARDANVFVSRVADAVALNMLKGAAQRARSLKKKRIVPEYLGTVAAVEQLPAPAPAAEPTVDDGGDGGDGGDEPADNDDALPPVPPDLATPSPPAVASPPPQPAAPVKKRKKATSAAASKKRKRTTE